jgi:hypothetical protein
LRRREKMIMRRRWAEFRYLLGWFEQYRVV